MTHVIYHTCYTFNIIYIHYHMGGELTATPDTNWCRTLQTYYNDGVRPIESMKQHLPWLCDGGIPRRTCVVLKLELYPWYS